MGQEKKSILTSSANSLNPEKNRREAKTDFLTVKVSKKRRRKTKTCWMWFTLSSRAEHKEEWENECERASFDRNWVIFSFQIKRWEKTR